LVHPASRRKLVASFWVWAVALAVYALFRAWYDNWRGKLSAEEISAIIGRMSAENASSTGRNDIEIMRRFLQADDGREFFMLNLVRLADGDVPDPQTGTLRPARSVMQSYTKQFLPALFARAGHPALVARKVGGYFDAWGVEGDPGWTIVGYMRYRSRRDLAQLVSDPRFGGAHDFKFAAMPKTYSFPTQPSMMTLASPRIWVGLSIVSAAALVQIALLLLIGTH
jgi:hypothetical protein